MLILDLRDRFFNYLGVYHDREFVQRIESDFLPDLDLICDINGTPEFLHTEADLKYIETMKRKYLRFNSRLFYSQMSPRLRTEFRNVLYDLETALIDHRLKKESR